MTRIVVGLVGLIVVAGAWYVTRLQTDLARLEGQLEAERVVRTAVSAPAEEPPPAPRGTGRQLTGLQRESMIAALGGTGMSSTNPVWFATVTNNPEAAAFRRALAGVFEEAGWQVRGNTAVRFPMKPGVYMFAADEEPPDYVDQVGEALEAAGITLTATGHGYRSFYDEKKKADPEWVGLDMGPDATYLIVIGRQPEGDPAA